MDPLLGAPRSSGAPVHWTAWTPGFYATGYLSLSSLFSSVFHSYLYYCCVKLFKWFAAVYNILTLYNGLNRHYKLWYKLLITCVTSRGPETKAVRSEHLRLMISPIEWCKWACMPRITINTKSHSQTLPTSCCNVIVKRLIVELDEQHLQTNKIKSNSLSVTTCAWQTIITKVHMASSIFIHTNPTMNPTEWLHVCIYKQLKTRRLVVTGVRPQYSFRILCRL